MTFPILYSLRNCPYAMRARLAIFKAKLPVELRDVVLKNKPEHMLAASPKGTVPTLVLPSSQVIDESLEVMLWALSQNDPENLLQCEKPSQDGIVEEASLLNTTNREQTATPLAELLSLIDRFDREFKSCLEQYKCAKRYHEGNVGKYRQACEVYIQDLEQRLTDHTFLLNDHESLADIALLPFIRQFAKVERQWYLQSPYPKVKQWLNQYLQSPMFTKVMAKYPLWLENDAPVIFGDV